MKIELEKMLYPVEDNKVILEGRLVQVMTGGKTSNFSWHSFSNLRRRFQRCFGYPMPGVTDCYRKMIRATFDLEAFNQKATSMQKNWLRECIAIDSPTFITVAGSNHTSVTLN